MDIKKFCYSFFLTLLIRAIHYFVLNVGGSNALRRRSAIKR